MAKIYLIEFKKTTGPAVYYFGQYSGLGGQYHFTRSIDMASRYNSQAEAQQALATLPMAESLNVTEHQFDDGVFINESQP